MKITRALLKRLQACKGGFNIVESLLPMTFDKDVEKNIDTAIKLIEAYAAASPGGRWLFDDLEWLLRKLTMRKPSQRLTQLTNTWIMRGEVYQWTSNNLLDPLTVAQMMSWIADKDKTC